MAHITGKKTIFFVTSPRSPYKLADEIKFLAENFSGKIWNTTTQKEYYVQLSKQSFFEGSVAGDIAFKARDRVNRAPKSLGFVDLKPVILLTDAGKKYVYGKRPKEVFLRQLIKMQLPSPFHTDIENNFNIKPYLELMRLIYDLGGLSKTEIALFVVQLTDYAHYNEIKQKIEQFRAEKKTLRDKKISYKKYVQQVFENELAKLFELEIDKNDISTRQSSEFSLDKFIKTKRSNHLDYADAAIRYLRATGLFTLEPRSFKIITITEKMSDVEYVLNHTLRDIFLYKNEDEYKEYLFKAETPSLLTDDIELLVQKIRTKSKDFDTTVLKKKTIEELKDCYFGLVAENLYTIVDNEKKQLRTYGEYDSIIETFSEIEKKDIADPSLFLEWNIWRAFTMLNDGEIIGNFRIDDDGVPLYTALGNMSDIVCKYKNFEAIVEVTLSSGSKQFEMEGESVARHFGNYKKSTSKDVYGLFIVPKINPSVIAYFYSLYRMNIDFYGGQAKIIPICLDDFKVLLKNAYEAEVKPTSEAIQKLLAEFVNGALKSKNEIEWYGEIIQISHNAFRIPMNELQQEENVIETMGGILEHTRREKKFYITTPIYYVNDVPHIGHSYTTIVADVIARYYRMRGYEVQYVTGTDENSQKNVDAAEKAGEKDLAVYLDTMSGKWRETWQLLDISNDDFIRTTEERHLKAVNQFWKKVSDNGDIYKGTYDGWYCVACEAFYLEQDLLEGGLCPMHKKPVGKVSEENYFFKLTKYRDALLEYIEVHPEFVQPVSRRHEIVNYIKDHMSDISISRQNARCGIEVPGDTEHKIYVWFDALINYLSAVGYGTDGEKFDRWWPADLHLVGKDIIKFHCALWPAMLMSAQLPLPRQVFAHGFFTVNGEKMSKTTGNVVSPLLVAEKYGIDTMRYYLLREISFGEDGDFSIERLEGKYTTELGNELGNLVHRVLSMTEKYCEGMAPKSGEGSNVIPWEDYAKAMERYQFGLVLDTVWSVIRRANKFIDDEKPWAVFKEDPACVCHSMGTLLETLRHIAWMLRPIMPKIANGIITQLGLVAVTEFEKTFEEGIEWGGLFEGTRIAKGQPLFPRIESMSS